MRGAPCVGEIKSVCEVQSIASGYRAVLTIPHHGTYEGDTRTFHWMAAADLLDLKTKHLGGKAGDGFSAKQKTDIEEAFKAQAEKRAAQIDCMNSCRPETCCHPWAK